MKVLLACALLLTSSLLGAAPEIQLQVDAREISRSLLHARLEIPAAPGPLLLSYPKWIPGVHAPAGPVQNLAGLRFETLDGQPINWQRDDEELYDFHLHVPAGADRIVAKLDYICNQPSVNSSGVDCFGNSLLGVINWNTMLLYPSQTSIDETRATIELQLPEGWKYGTALKPASSPLPARLRFAPDSLRRVVDSPLICGANLRSIELHAKDQAPAYLHLTSESASALQLDEKLINQYRALVSEALALFGGHRWEAYHFLVVCSDNIPRNGLEHLASSFNAVGERELIDEKKRKSWPAYLIPHEFVHSWCGKFRRPAAMLTTNFQRPERTKLLWIYEGLTQYLGELLTVRSGLLTPEEYLPALANKVDFLLNQEGRQWRSLEDTAVAAHLGRARSPAWAQLRRSQDYYDEGLIIWLEADALIRAQTNGKKTLDDFCQRFFEARPEGPLIAPYELPQVTSLLNELVEYDWNEFFAERIAQPRPTLNLEFFPKNLGHRLQYGAKASDFTTEREKERKQSNLLASIGLSVGEDGSVQAVRIGSAADRAGLANGMTITAVNQRKFSSQRLKDAVAESVTSRKIDLLVLEGDEFRSRSLSYAEGSRFLEIVRHSEAPDTLGSILRPTSRAAAPATR